MNGSSHTVHCCVLNPTPVLLHPQVGPRPPNFGAGRRLAAHQNEALLFEAEMVRVSAAGSRCWSVGSRTTHAICILVAGLDRVVLCDALTGMHLCKLTAGSTCPVAWYTHMFACAACLMNALLCTHAAGQHVQHVCSRPSQCCTLCAQSGHVHTSSAVCHIVRDIVCCVGQVRDPQEVAPGEVDALSRLQLSQGLPFRLPAPPVLYQQQ
jgi:hypothetical protein